MRHVGPVPALPRRGLGVRHPDAQLQPALQQQQGAPGTLLPHHLVQVQEKPQGFRGERDFFFFFFWTLFTKNCDIEF